jgi:REP element-mobilizing transposase RayT
MKTYNRRTIRLKGYDYTQSGAYFVTICTHERVCLFGEAVDGAMALSHAGEIAQARWFAIPHHHPNIELDAFVVMPNHVHGIVIIVGTGSAPSTVLSTGSTLPIGVDNAGVVPTVSLGTVIGSYKSGVTRRIREDRQQPELPIWQSRYYDHIIRNEQDLNRIRQYIDANPASWEADSLYG